MNDVTEWVETQQQLQDEAVKGLVLISPYTTKQKGLARAMAVCGAVAKLYRKRGQPPTWLHIEQPSNRHVKRRMSRTVRPIEYICNNCRLPFMGATRCQCKSAVKAREMVEVEV